MAISAAEQYMLELINRTRLDPLGEARRQGIDLNKDLTPGLLHSGVRGVLAPEAALERAAIGHSLWMLTTDTISHTGVNGSTPSDRAFAAGYRGSGAGENISWRGTTGGLDLEAFIGQQHTDLFLSSGHRVNLFRDTYREIGLAQEAGSLIYNGVPYSSSMVTQNFSTQTDKFYVTGVVYDDLNRDKFYSFGEGRAKATFATTGDATTSAFAGGYALEAAEGGAVLVTGRVDGRAFAVRIVVDEVNAKLDVVNGDTFYASADLTLVSGVNKAALLGVAAIDATGNRNANSLVGNAAANVLSGLDGNDSLDGQGGNDRIYGGSGGDRLSGGSGRDMIYGNSGNDQLTGGVGADRFVFGMGAGDDVITDFSRDDDLRLDARIWDGNVSSAARLLAAHARVVAGDVVISLGQDHSVTLDGVSSLAGLADQIVLF